MATRISGSLDDGRITFNDQNTNTNIRVTDPVCGMEIERPQAAAVSDYRGTLYYFCSEACQAEFEGNPERYAISADQPGASSP